MILRIFKTKNMDLDTIEFMIHQADKQANFHPDSRWILLSTDGEIKNFNLDESDFSKKFKEFHVKWIGREAVVNWFLANQINFEIISHDFLKEELSALEDLDHEEESMPEEVILN